MKDKTFKRVLWLMHTKPAPISKTKAMVLIMIPAPKKININDEKVYFSMTYTTVNFDYSVQGALRTMSDYCDRVFFKSMQRNDEKPGVICVCDETLDKNSYEIIAENDKINIKAQSVEALGYAFTTLLQAMEKDENGIYVNKMNVQDCPGCDWRGLMVDLGRLFMPIQKLLNFIDLCWLYKINKIQIHFSDSPQYTLPSDAFPKISKENNSYTKEEIIMMRAYAKQRGVMLVPEIDMPGHSLWLMECYPETFGTTLVMCAEEKTFQALFTLIDEVIDLFPDSPYIHLGGDEADIHDWEKCEGCVAYMKEHDIPNVDALYAHYLKRITDHVTEKGRTPIIWEGFAKEYNYMISKDVIVAEFESLYQLAPELIEGGFKVLNCSWKPLYVIPRGDKNCAPEVILKTWDIYRWQNWFEKSPASKHDIVVPDGSPVIGGQLCNWMDPFQRSFNNELGWNESFALVRERLPAVAENTWNVGIKPDIDAFKEKYAKTDKILDKLITR